MENEVVVLPGTISDYGYEDMIPAAKETVPQILARTLAEFQYYGKQARLLGYQEEALFQVHVRWKGFHRVRCSWPEAYPAGAAALAYLHSQCRGSFERGGPANPDLFQPTP